MGLCDTGFPNPAAAVTFPSRPLLGGWSLRLTGKPEARLSGETRLSATSGTRGFDGAWRGLSSTCLARSQRLPYHRNWARGGDGNSAAKTERMIAASSRRRPWRPPRRRRSRQASEDWPRARDQSEDRNGSLATRRSECKRSLAGKPKALTMNPKLGESILQQLT